MNFSKIIDDKKYIILDDLSERPIIETDKCDYIGFRPISVRIKEMKSKGELNELMIALENQGLTLETVFGVDNNTDVINKPISVMSLKGLDKVELLEALKTRYKSYQSKLAVFQESLDAFRGVNTDVAASEPPHAESVAAELKDNK